MNNSQIINSQSFKRINPNTYSYDTNFESLKNSNIFNSNDFNDVVNQYVRYKQESRGENINQNLQNIQVNNQNKNQLLINSYKSQIKLKKLRNLEKLQNQRNEDLYYLKEMEKNYPFGKNEKIHNKNIYPKRNIAMLKRDSSTGNIFSYNLKDLNVKDINYINNNYELKKYKYLLNAEKDEIKRAKEKYKNDLLEQIRENNLRKLKEKRLKKLEDIKDDQRIFFQLAEINNQNKHLVKNNNITKETLKNKIFDLKNRINTGQKILFNEINLLESQYKRGNFKDKAIFKVIKELNDKLIPKKIEVVEKNDDDKIDKNYLSLEKVLETRFMIKKEEKIIDILPPINRNGNELKMNEDNWDLMEIYRRNNEKLKYLNDLEKY